MTLRESMRSREGAGEADRQISRGLRAWAIVRSGDRARPQTAIVFGTCRSDALRRASAPSRLGEELHHERTRAEAITSGWDEPIQWPIPDWRSA
jgi:hypothetical protein